MTRCFLKLLHLYWFSRKEYEKGYLSVLYLDKNEIHMLIKHCLLMR